MSAVYNRIAPLVLQERADRIARNRAMEQENIRVLRDASAELLEALATKIFF